VDEFQYLGSMIATDRGPQMSCWSGQCFGNWKRCGAHKVCSFRQPRCDLNSISVKPTSVITSADASTACGLV